MTIFMNAANQEERAQIQFEIDNLSCRQRDAIEELAESGNDIDRAFMESIGLSTAENQYQYMAMVDFFMICQSELEKKNAEITEFVDTVVSECKKNDCDIEQAIAENGLEPSELDDIICRIKFAVTSLKIKCTSSLAIHFVKIIALNSIENSSFFLSTMLNTRKLRTIMRDAVETLETKAVTIIKKPKVTTSTSSACEYAKRHMAGIKAANRIVKRENTILHNKTIGKIQYVLTNGVLLVKMPKVPGVNSSKFIRSYLKTKGIRRLGKTTDEGVIFSSCAANEIMFTMKMNKTDILYMREKGYSLSKIAQVYNVSMTELALFCAKNKVLSSDAIRKEVDETKALRQRQLWQQCHSVFGAVA